ncbi:E3 ubiquitin-protein ligase CBL-C [Tupaia chinensis]|uniref:E3 ubiquitin-protein ligase CBL-C n=1 Tax=Tupaia chinensis TaxID=246437 RepID=UPI0003C8C650|nr:E3 ubiquitin-protein ligase CBL-C [Tupaia chinensis]
MCLSRCPKVQWTQPNCSAMKFVRLHSGSFPTLGRAKNVTTSQAVDFHALFRRRKLRHREDRKAKIWEADPDTLTAFTWSLPSLSCNTNIEDSTRQRFSSSTRQGCSDGRFTSHPKALLSYFLTAPCCEESRNFVAKFLPPLTPTPQTLLLGDPGHSAFLLEDRGLALPPGKLGSLTFNPMPRLPRIAQLLREVAQARREASGGCPEGPGGAGDFLVIYLANLEAKSRQVAALLPPRGRKNADDELFREGSRFRRQLAKLAIVFSHMHAELGALFPRGAYCGHTYQLTKSAPHAFWRQHCGARCVLPWAEFESLLGTCHPVEPGPVALALRSTVDLTCSGHVSVFEFDIFTRLFQPWPTLLKNWQLLAVNHPGYMAFLTYDEVQARLQACRDKPGSYIFRPSCTRPGQWAIGYVNSDGSILQTIPSNKPLFHVLLEGQKNGFYLYPDGKSHNPDLTELCQIEPHQRIHVSKEQLQLYWAMDSTFELCKICAESDKDVKIEPCGHLLCSRCLATWQQSDSQTCPFCRCEIKGREAVSIYQLQGKSAGALATAQDLGDSSSQDEEELEPGQVVPSAPPLPPRLDLSPQTPRRAGPLTVAPPALPRLRAPFPLPKIKTVALAPWEMTSSSPARERATENS